MKFCVLFTLDYDWCFPYTSGMAKTTLMKRVGALLPPGVHKEMKSQCKRLGMKEGAFMRFAVQEKLDTYKVEASK